MKRNRLYLLIFSPVFIIFSCGKVSRSPNDSAIRPPDSTATDANVYTPQSINDDVVGASQQKQELVKKYDNLLVFHADDTMEVNRVYVATLALGKNAELQRLVDKVLEDASSRNVITDTTVEIGKRMTARLIDVSPRKDRSFEITPLSPDEQSLVSKNKEAVWQWNVEPLKEGNHQLKLTVAVTLTDEDTYGLPAKDIPVIIFATKASVAGRVGKFLLNYWQWIITGICVPIVVAWFTTWFRFRAEQKNKNPQVPVQNQKTERTSTKE